MRIDNDINIICLIDIIIIGPFLLYFLQIFTVVCIVTSLASIKSADGTKRHQNALGIPNPLPLLYRNHKHSGWWMC